MRKMMALTKSWPFIGLLSSLSFSSFFSLLFFYLFFF